MEPAKGGQARIRKVDVRCHIEYEVDTLNGALGCRHGVGLRGRGGTVKTGDTRKGQRGDSSDGRQKRRKEADQREVRGKEDH